MSETMKLLTAHSARISKFVDEGDSAAQDALIDAMTVVLWVLVSHEEAIARQGDRRSASSDAAEIAAKDRADLAMALTRIEAEQNKLSALRADYDALVAINARNHERMVAAETRHAKAERIIADQASQISELRAEIKRLQDGAREAIAGAEALRRP